MEQNLKIKYSLKKLPRDERDFKFGALFKPVPLTDLPSQFKVPGMNIIKDQKYTDYCTCFSGTEVSEDQELVELDPLWQFMKAKQIEGGDVNSFGCDLRSMAKSFKNYGSIEKTYSPYNIDTDRSIITDPSKWTDKPYDTLAESHKKESYLFVDGPYDLFDNLRSTMYRNKRSAAVGFDWCLEYNSAPNGVVDSVGTPFGGHAVKLCGWGTINGKLYMIAQMSNGIDYGDKGYLYFSREVINAQGDYGAVTFIDRSSDSVQTHIDAGVRLDSSWIIRLLLILWNKII